MKRKRGNKKGKPKGRLAAAAAACPPPTPSHDAEQSSSDAEEAENAVHDKSEHDDDVDIVREGQNDDDIDNDRNDDAPPAAPMEVGAPPSTAPEQKEETPPPPPPPPAPAPAVKQPLVFNRVKVKLKTSKPPAAPVVISPSDNNKNNGGDKNESVNISRNSSERVENKAEERREESIVGKGSSSGNTASLSSPAGAAAKEEVPRKEEPKTPRKPQYDKQELDSALMIIKKVMKMDAAEPFNVPVNPEALGIPDYFDIIDTPMDFGTICSNLEKGNKYMNAEGVYRDVQFIWDNCSKYNKKGDYILDLMKRVKKNFMKYWTAAGLYTEPTRGSSGTEGVAGEDIAASTQATAKTKKSKKRHGRRHKNDCMCAICVLKRRRREREENEQLAKGQAAVIDQEYKQEESSLMESPDGGEDSSSNMGESQDPDAELEVEGKEQEFKVDTERQSGTLEDKPDEEVDGENGDKEEEEEEENESDAKKRRIDVSEQSQFTEKQAHENVQPLQHVAAGDEGAVDQKHTDKVPELVEQKEEVVDVQQTEHKESLERAEKAKLHERFQAANPLLLELCSNLFPCNRRSVWNGPHSLLPYRGPTRRSSIFEAVEALMK